MRITARGRYALRGALRLASMSKNGASVSINTLAEKENISTVFLEQIFFRLGKAGLVMSVRGAGGGFCFTRPLGEITVKEILLASGEELSLTLCDKSRKECADLEFCISHKILEGAHERMNDYFAGLTLAGILQEYGGAASFPAKAKKAKI